jgi:hypothetical protein
MSNQTLKKFLYLANFERVRFAAFGKQMIRKRQEFGVPFSQGGRALF